MLIVVTVPISYAIRCNIQNKIDEAEKIIQLLKEVPGMTSAHHRDFPRSDLFITCKSGISVRTWRNPVNVLHVFVADDYGELIFGGFVGWIHTDDLLACLRDIKMRFELSKETKKLNSFTQTDLYTKYRFYSTTTKDLFIGSVKDFCDLYDLDLEIVFELVAGKIPASTIQHEYKRVYKYY